MLPTTETQPPKTGMDRLFQELMAMYGKHFAQQWAGCAMADVKDTWKRGLAGMTRDELAAGVIACRQRKYPPTLPEFIALCRPVTDPEIAYIEAVKGMAARREGRIGVWTHLAVYWAAVEIGQFDLVNNGYQAIKAQWAKALSDQFARGSWDLVPDVPPALPAPATTQADAQQARRVSSMTAKAATTKRDQRAWALRVAANPSRFSLAVLEMANRALASGGVEA